MNDTIAEALEAAGLRITFEHEQVFGHRHFNGLTKRIRDKYDTVLPNEFTDADILKIEIESQECRIDTFGRASGTRATELNRKDKVSWLHAQLYNT